jgi:hypothetical protein
VKLPIPESIIEELRSMVAPEAIVVAANGETLNAEDALGLIALAQRPGPDLSVGQLCNAGFNGFAFELLVESVRKFRDFEKFGPFRISLRGVSITLAYDPESDAALKARRTAQGLPEQDPHWAERPNGELAAIVAQDEPAAYPHVWIQSVDGTPYCRRCQYDKSWLDEHGTVVCERARELATEGR